MGCDKKSKDKIIDTMLLLVIGILTGALVGIAISRYEYQKTYIELRSEIILATGVDISYPYKDSEELNHSWFKKGGK